MRISPPCLIRSSSPSTSLVSVSVCSDDSTRCQAATRDGSGAVRKLVRERRRPSWRRIRRVIRAWCSQSEAAGGADSDVGPHVCHVNGTDGGDRLKDTASDDVLASERGNATRVWEAAQGRDVTGEEGPRSGSPRGRREQEYSTPVHCFSPDITLIVCLNIKCESHARAPNDAIAHGEALWPRWCLDERRVESPRPGPVRSLRSSPWRTR